MKIKKNIFFLLIFLFTLSFSFSQEITISSGDTESNQNFTIDYSIGQIFFQSTPSSDYTGVRSMYKEGVHQVYFVDSGIRTPNFNVVVKVYPNPSKGIFNISLDLSASDLVGLTYSIYSTQGKFIRSGQVETNPFSIDVSEFSSGVYFMYIHDNTNQTKLIKIIKN